jgi:hypothetical protein
MQVRQDLIMPPRRGRGLRVLHHHLSPLLRQAHHSRMTPQQRHIPQRLTPPHAQGPPEQLTRPDCITLSPSCPGVLGKTPERQQVKLDTTGLHPVPHIGSLQ